MRRHQTDWRPLHRCPTSIDQPCIAQLQQSNCMMQGVRAQVHAADP